MKVGNYEIFIADDPDLNELYAEIQYDGEAVFLITQEKGPQNLEIELLNRTDEKNWKFRLSEFTEIVEKAKQRLIGK